MKYRRFIIKFFLPRVFVIVVFYYGYVTFASFMIQFYVPMDFLETPFFKLIQLEPFVDFLLYSRPHLHGPVNWILRTAFRTIIVLIIGIFLGTLTLYLSTEFF